MARPLSKAAIARRTAKSKATREAKQKAALADLGIDVKRKKIRKPRKEMTPEQKALAAERLAKAREAKGPAKNSSYDASIRDLPDEHPLSIKKVRQWINTQKEILSSVKHFKDSKESSERAKYNEVFTYVQNLEAYLKYGVYFDHKSGEHMENTIQHTCVKMAYYPDGTPKRTIGVYYPDLGKVYEGDNGNTISEQESIHEDGRKRRARKTA
jgi:hypothetical protein